MPCPYAISRIFFIPYAGSICVTWGSGTVSFRILGAIYMEELGTPPYLGFFKSSIDHAARGVAPGMDVFS
jgi:hypothetical protein